MSQEFRDLPLRTVAFIVVFSILALFLYGVQVAYESPGQHPMAKAALFAGVIMGSGLCWDITKHVTQLKSKQLRRFLSSLGKTFLFGVLYVVFFAVAFLLIGAWAGPQTIVSPFIAIVSMYFLLKTNHSLSVAIESAVRIEESPNHG